jgi:hypothetical protein
MSGLRGYDAWKTRSDLDEEARWPNQPETEEPEPPRFSCDCCGEPSSSVTRLWVYGLETFACNKCRGWEDEE